jgi:hypothetical protein
MPGPDKRDPALSAGLNLHGIGLPASLGRPDDGTTVGAGNAPAATSSDLTNL